MDPCLDIQSVQDTLSVLEIRPKCDSQVKEKGGIIIITRHRKRHDKENTSRDGMVR